MRGERGKLRRLPSFYIFDSVSGDQVEQLLYLLGKKNLFLTSDQHIFSPYIVDT